VLSITNAAAAALPQSYRWDFKMETITINCIPIPPT
jgi:hypothetical protein